MLITVVVTFTMFETFICSKVRRDGDDVEPDDVSLSDLQHQSVSGRPPR